MYNILKSIDKTKIKNFFVSENILLLNGEALTLMEELSNLNIKFNSIITDPPFGITSCSWDNIIDLEKMWENLKILTDKSIPIILFGREPFTSKLISSNYKMYKHKWIWNKKISGSFQNAKYMPLQIEEDIICFADGKVNYYPIMRTGKFRKKGGSKKKSEVTGNGLYGTYETFNDQYFPTNILEFPNNRKGKIHPTQKPVELMEYLIKTYTKENDIILDFTFGSASTIIAAINTNRKIIGIELDENYFNLSIERVNNHLNINI